MKKVFDKKVLCFDLDGTLAKLSKGATIKTVRLLKKLEKAGNIICIASGKPCYYLCGFARQLGLKNPILLGENGGAFMEGVSLPPKVFKRADISKDDKNYLLVIVNEIKSKMPDLFYQPNEIGFTPFFSLEAERVEIEEIIDDNRLIAQHLQVFRHIDSFDFMPKGINKYSGLELISEFYNIKKENFIAIGDGENDLPMFEFCLESYGVNFNKAKYNFSSIEKVLSCLVERYGK